MLWSILEVDIGLSRTNDLSAKTGNCPTRGLLARHAAILWRA